MDAPVEIEKKYLPACGPDGAQELMQRLPEFLTAAACGCEVEDLGEMEQEDTYLDTAGGALRAMDQTLRVRCVAGGRELTFKSPLGAGGSAGPDGRMERREYTQALREESGWRTEGADFLRMHLGGAVRAEELEEMAVIHNRRRRLRILWEPRGAAEEYELSFDHVTYRNRCLSTELQIELEYKSGGTGQTAMQRLTALLEAEFPQLIPSVESKYARALRLDICTKL